MVNGTSSHNDTGTDKNMSLFDDKTLDTTDYETIDYMTYVNYTAIAYSVMLAFGLPGNVLCIITLSQKAFSDMARTSVCVMLSLVDSFYLSMQHMRILAQYIRKMDVVHESIITCKMGAFCYSFLSHMDGFMIVLMSLERFLAVYKPHLVKILITPRRMKLAICCITVFFLIFDGESMIR